MRIDQNTIEGLITPIIEAMGYVVWHVELHKSQHKILLRIYVDVPEGDDRKSVSLDDCGLISNQIGSLLDVEGLLPESYVLEVSSPGLDRALFVPAHYQKYIGSVVKIVLKEPQSGRSNFTGKILDVVDNKIELEVDNENIIFELSSVYKAKLIEGEKK